MNFCNHCNASLGHPPPIQYTVNNHYYYYGSHLPPPPTNQIPMDHFPAPASIEVSQQNSNVSNGLVSALNNLANQFQTHVTQEVMSNLQTNNNQRSMANSVVLNQHGAGFLLDPSQLPALMSQGPNQGIEVLLATLNENGEWVFSNWESDHGEPLHLTQEEIDSLECVRLSNVNNVDDQCPACSICQNNFDNNDLVVVLACNHYFHKACVSHWLLRANTCPLCRTIVEVSHNDEEIPEPPLSP